MTGERKSKMRNSKQQPSTPSSNAEVNLVILSMKGDTGALSKSIESLVQTFRGQNGYVLASAPATPRPPAAALSATSAVEEDAGLPDQQLTLDEIDTPAPPATTSRPARGRTAPRPAKIVDELKAHEEPGGFKSFVNGRSFSSDNKKGLAAAAWLKDHDVAQFNIDHINTCFSMVKWSMPNDPGQLLRNMTKVKTELLRHVDKKPGFYELTAKGVNEYSAIP